jgi:hypothetical protein
MAVSPTIRSSSPYLPFVELGRLGLQDWWRFALVGGLVLGIPELSYPLFVDLLDRFDPGLAAALYEREVSGWEADFPLWPGVVEFSLSFLWIAVAIPVAFLFVPLVHGRPWQTLVMAPEGFDWRGFGASLAATVAVLGAPLVPVLLFWPEHLHVVFDAGRFAWFLLPLLLLVPAQTLAEEIVYRGYVLQSVAAMTDSITARLAIPSVLFAAIHFQNPEVIAGGPWAKIDHVVGAVYMTFLAIRSNGLAHVWGFHLGWNWVAFTLFAPGAPAYEPQPAIFADDSPISLDDVWTVLWTMAGCTAHYWLTGYLLRRWRRDPRAAA